MKINPLLCAPSPRDIREPYEALKRCPYDRLYAKYFPEKIAYNLLRDWFLDHEEYTHLVICPDDLIIEPEHLEALIKTLEEKDYPVFSGVCNVDVNYNSHLLNITDNLPHPQRMVPARKQIGWRWYSWINKDRKFESPIMRFPFSGFAAMFIRRDVVKRYKFTDDAALNGTPDLVTGAIDVMFANVCAIENIPQMVDTRVRMHHLKNKNFDIEITLGDGELRFYPARKDTYTIEYAEAKNKERMWHLKGKDKVIEGTVTRKE